MLLSRRQIPNLITSLRVLLVVPIAFCLLGEAYKAALLLFVVAGLSDGVDGYLARRFNWRSRFGAITDPIADKLLLVSTFLLLTIGGHIHWGLTALVFLRDLVIVSGALAYHYLVGPYEMNPTRLGKLNTLLQISYLLLVMLHLAGLTMPPALLHGGALAVILIALASGAHYVALWTRKYLENRPRGRIDL